MKRRKGKKHIVETLEYYGFTSTKYLCACIVVDISNYTNIISPLSFHRDKHQKYISIFDNTMEAIARNFGAIVVENHYDKVISFFLKTSKPSSDKTPFKDVLKCGLTMQAAHEDMNQIYYEEGLPPINYRIGADCAKIQKQALVTCLNIYTLGPRNGMVIGENLYDMINDSFEGDYRFTKIHEYPPQDCGKKCYPRYLNPYSVYLISRTSVTTGFYSNIMLIDDDEPDMIVKYKSFLHPEGYKVDAFINSKEALRHFAKVSPSYYDLVIMDIKRPNLNGLQLYNRMKAINSSVKVLFVSALDAVEELVSILPDIFFKRNWKTS